MLLRICDPDEVWITSKRLTKSLSYADDSIGNTAKDLLRGKNVYLVTEDDGDGNRYTVSLQTDLAATSHVVLEIKQYWDVNEIYLIEENRVVAAITGSSECIRRDLDRKPRPGDNYEFDTKTDVIHYIVLFHHKGK